MFPPISPWSASLPELDGFGLPLAGPCWFGTDAVGPGRSVPELPGREVPGCCGVRRASGVRGSCDRSGATSWSMASNTELT